MSDSGYITRDHLASPLGHLALFVVEDAAIGVPTYFFAEDGLDPGQAPQRRQISETMFNPGASQLGATPGMADTKYELIVTGSDGTTLDANIGKLVTAVMKQPSWELHVLFEGDREWAWSHWTGDEPTIGFAASFWAPDASAPYQWAPVTIVTKRDPVLVAGPY